MANDPVHERLRHLEIQQARFKSHLTSELGNITRQLNEMNAAMKEMQNWKNRMVGRDMVIGILIGAIVSVVIRYLTK